jgi:GMP synthase-like glutamine amidotransferase
MTKPIKINVLLCDTFPGRLPEDIPSYVSMHEKLFSDAVGKVDFEVFMAMEGELPQQLSLDEIYMIPGCMYSAYNPLPWINALQNWAHDAVARGVFLVGICFGHQLIAQAMGGTVEHYSGGWGTGVRESTVIDESMLDYFPDGKLRLLYNHHDQVITPPEGSVTLATSNFCQFEALRYGNHVYTFQGHPEYTPYYIEYYLNNLAADQDPKIVERARRSLQAMKPQGIAVARWVVTMYKRWLRTRCAQ